ncbi:hypothetical protein NW765_016300 [Fusarium oxysporum]|nr:hypothetical protein NW765_016300 [Fusarium oxysporum]
MSRHLRESHNISIYCSKKGRPAKGAAKEVSSPYFRSRVTYQRLFPTGPRSEYFEVSPEAGPAKPSDQEVPIKDFYSNRSLLVQKDANMMEQPDQFTQPSPWLDRLGCEFLRGLISLNLDLSPGGFEDSDDFIYLMVFKVLDQLVWEAQGLIYRQEVPLNARFEVARYDLNTASRKPFNFCHKQETKRRYANITKQLIVYTLRCLGLDNPAERPPFKVSRQQQKAYDDLMEVADQLEEQWKVAQGQLSDRILAQLLEDLKRETLRLFMTILRQQTKDSEHESIMVSFLSVLSIAPRWIVASSALTAARQVLFRDLLFQQDYSVLDAQPAAIPAIPWGKLQDNANDDALGYGVADSLYEVAGEDSKTWLISRIWTTPELKVRWYPNPTTASAPPSITVLSSYLELVDQMLEHLLFLIHLSAGLPARSTEILTIRHRNTAAGGIRNIFIDRGLVMIIIGIHKNLSQSQRLKGYSSVSSPREPNPNDKYISPSIKSFTPARMTRIIKRWGAAIGIDSLGISAWRHISVAIGRRFIRDAAITSQGHFAEAADGDSDSEVSDQEDIGEHDTILNKQTGHSAQTSAMVYGRGIQEAHFETHQRRESSAAVMPSCKGAKRSGAYLDLEQFQQLQISRWKQLRGIDISLELDRLFNRPSVFKPGQHKVLTAIMQNQSPIVTVLPTSGGKSLLFQLPVASCPTGVTVVVVPLVALQGDLFKRTQEMNIPTAQWRSDQIVGRARLVFVTPETIFTKHFQGYLDALQSQAQLDRMLRELGRLAQRGIQMVYLTATLPIAEEAEFFSLIYSTPKSATFFRFPTTRRSIRYSISSFNIQGVDDAAAVAVAAVRDSIDQILTRYASTAKVIVYCQTKKATQAMAEALGCEAYYSDVGTEDDKARRLQDWMHGIYREDAYQKGRVIVATNALGLGIDIPDIRLIVHLEMPRRIGDYGRPRRAMQVRGDGLSRVRLSCFELGGDHLIR